MNALLKYLMVLFMLAGPAAAQVSLGINIYGGGGVTFPTGDLSDITKTGFHGLVGFGYSPVPMLEAVGRFAYHSLPFEENDDENITISEYGIDVRASLAAPGFKFRPYALIGAGFAKYDFTQDAFDAVTGGVDAALGGLEPKTKFFYCFGGGFKVSAFPRLNFFLEGRYSRISVEHGTISYFPITAGLNISL